MTYYSLTKDMPMIMVQLTTGKYPDNIIGGVVERTDLPGQFDCHFYGVNGKGGWTSVVGSFEEGEKLIRNTFASHLRNEWRTGNENTLQRQLTLY